MNYNYDALYRVQGPAFHASMGIGIDGLVNWTAPMLIHMVGWHRQRVIDYCHEKHWQLEQIGGYPDD